MLRSLVLILLLVNGAFFAWRQGWLNDVVGLRPDAQHEPHRLAQQIAADMIVVVPPAKPPAPAAPSLPAESEQTTQPAMAPPPVADAASEATAAQAEGSTETSSATGITDTASTMATASTTLPPASPPAAAPGATTTSRSICIEAGPFTAAEYASAEAMLRPLLPSGEWGRRAVSISGAWLVYMGPYTDTEQLQRKQEELKRIKDLDFEVVRSPANLAMGISLGRFSKPENADNQLEILKKRGIRTARIVTVRQPADLLHLRVARANVDTQVKLSALKLPQGKDFTACRP